MAGPHLTWPAGAGLHAAMNEALSDRGIPSRILSSSTSSPPSSLDAAARSRSDFTSGWVFGDAGDEVTKSLRTFCSGSSNTLSSETLDWLAVSSDCDSDSDVDVDAAVTDEVGESLITISGGVIQTKLSPSATLPSYRIPLSSMVHEWYHLHRRCRRLLKQNEALVSDMDTAVPALVAALDDLELELAKTKIEKATLQEDMLGRLELVDVMKGMLKINSTLQEDNEMIAKEYTRASRERAVLKEDLASTTTLLEREREKVEILRSEIHRSEEDRDELHSVLARESSALGVVITQLGCELQEERKRRMMEEERVEILRKIISNSQDNDHLSVVPNLEELSAENSALRERLELLVDSSAVNAHLQRSNEALMSEVSALRAENAFLRHTQRSKMALDSSRRNDVDSASVCDKREVGSPAHVEVNFHDSDRDRHKNEVYSPSSPEYMLRKERFFRLCLSLKLELHGVVRRNIPIQELYDAAQAQEVPEDQWEHFFREQFLSAFTEDSDTIE